MGVLSSRRNLIVSAPTNSGKSAIGELSLLQTVRRGQRAVLLEPLRALAREKYDDFERRRPDLEAAIGHRFQLTITTGDYRLDHDAIDATSPHGEIIIATPERLEAITRNPDSRSWINSIGAVCIDEAHLMASPRRGPTLETLVTTLLCLTSPPRVILLSATLGNLDRAKQWLDPCDLVRVTGRYPPLEKHVIEVVNKSDRDATVELWVRNALFENDAQVIVFVYQTASAEKVSRDLTKALGPLVGQGGAQVYHSKLSAGQRELARGRFLRGESRVVVTTTALAMGVNLPATHVIVRDLTFPNAESPGVGDLLQMLGRAGRGDKTGVSAVLLGPGDDWTASDLRVALEEERLPDFASSFSADPSGSDGVPAATAQVLSFLSRAGDGGASQAQIEVFFGRSLGGAHLAPLADEAVFWAERNKLVFRGEAGVLALTRLGARATRAVLPLPLAAGLARLLRDWMTGDEADSRLASWRPMDALLLVVLLHDRTPRLRPFSEALVEATNRWMETNGAAAASIFSRSIRGATGASKAGPLLSSLGLAVSENASRRGTKGKRVDPREFAYRAAFHTILLWERSRGMSTSDIERKFGVKNFEGVEENWRDQVLWLLNGLARILDVRCFFFHLKEECKAGDVRIRRVKSLLGRIRHQVYDLQEQVKYASELGPVLLQMRRVSGGKAGVGIASIRKLEESGVTTLAALKALDVEALVQRGVQRHIARKIRAFTQRRIV